jgi:hypothetical protein
VVSLTQLQRIKALLSAKLGMFGVQTGVYKPALDIFQSCRPGA